MFFSVKMLRSPREKLGEYVILPRLIDKVRLHAEGILPPEYVPNLLRSPDPETGLFPLDGRFLDFTGLSPEELRRAILASGGDQEVLGWVTAHAIPRSSREIDAWRREIEQVSPSDQRTAKRRKNYPRLASREDLGTLSPFDLIDLDEGRPLP